MRLALTTLLALIPFAAAAGGHGTFYVCKADGLSEFEIEIAANDCMVNGSSATKTSDDPVTCDFGMSTLDTVTVANDLALEAVANGKTYAGQCRLR